MAAGRIVLPGWMPALDSNGAPIPNAQIYIYLNGTTTLATVYSDDTLTTPIANPVEANSSGQFPEIWADDANLFSISVDAPFGPPGIPFTFDSIGPATVSAVIEVATDAANAVVAGKANTDFSNVIASVGRAALELGNSATRNVGTTSGTVAAGDDSRITGALQGTSGTGLSNFPTVQIAYDLNPELPIRQFMIGHEGDADHTPRFNEAIDKLNAVSGNKGGTIRLDHFQYKIASVQPITFGAVTIKGVGMSEVRENSAPAIAQAKGLGTAITLLSGTGDAFTVGSSAGTGYDIGSFGLSDLTMFCDDRAGHAVVINRAVSPFMERVNIWRPDRGIRIYGGFEPTLSNVRINQLRGDYCLTFEGDANNRADALKLYDVFMGAKDATTNHNGAGIRWIGYAHSLQMYGVQVVNPTYGLFANDGGLSTANDFMRPHFLRAFGFEVDFATQECARLEHFRDFEFNGGYMHSAGSTQTFAALSHVVSTVNRNGQLRMRGGNLSNAGGSFGQVYTACNGAIYEGIDVQPPSAANLHGFYVDGPARKTSIRNCGIGETHVFVNPANTVGIRVRPGVLKTSIVGNDFYNCATAVVDEATAGETFQDANKTWGA